MSKITVIVSIFNNYVKTKLMYSKFIESLHNQTFKDFSVLAVDDNSTDRSISVLRNSKLPLLPIIKNKKNRGLTRSLMSAVKWIKTNTDTEFIVCHDADDYSMPDRFAKQIDLFQKHPEVSIIGSSVHIADRENKIMHRKDVPVSHEDIIKTMLDHNALFHSAVMMRRSIFDECSYNKKHEFAQDYGLWTTCALKGIRFAGINEPLVVRCKHIRSISSGKVSKSLQRRWAKRIRHAFQEQMGVETFMNREKTK